MIGSLPAPTLSAPPAMRVLRGSGSGETFRARELGVLIVEDNPGDVRLIREALRDDRVAFDIRVADSLAAAQELLAEYAPDAVILDLGLPDATGLAALVEIRNVAPELPIVILTGMDSAPLGVEALRLGAQDFLAKDTIECTLLSRLILYAVERKRLESAEAFISGTSRLLTSSLSLKETLAHLAEVSVAFLADYCLIETITREGRSDQRLIQFRDSTRRRKAGGSQSLDYGGMPIGLGREAISEGRPILATGIVEPDLKYVPELAEMARLLRARRIRSYMAMPMYAADELIGVLILLSGSRDYGPDDLELASRFAESASAALHNATLFEHSNEALRMRDRVLGVVAHDLRNPLATISMVADLLLDGRISEESQKKQLHILRRSADHMNRLIGDLLDVARIEQGQLALEKVYRSPARLVHDVVEGNRSLAVSRGLEIVADARGAGPVHVDADRITQVLINLVSNAIRFTPAGGKVTVGVENLPGGEEVRFWVDDDGPGIAEENRDLLFRPFWQGSADRGGGLGLGLAIAKRIVEAHDGRIWVEARSVGGTRLSFTLPRAPERRNEADATDVTAEMDLDADLSGSDADGPGDDARSGASASGSVGAESGGSEP